MKRLLLTIKNFFITMARKCLGILDKQGTPLVDGFQVKSTADVTGLDAALSGKIDSTTAKFDVTWNPTTKAITSNDTLDGYRGNGKYGIYHINIVTSQNEIIPALLSVVSTTSGTQQTIDFAYIDSSEDVHYYKYSRLYSNNTWLTWGNIDLSNKADKSVTLNGYGITDAYTKTQTYSQTEANNLLDTKANKVNDATNGHFAGLDSNGNLTDSGMSANSFLPTSTSIPTKTSDLTNDSGFLTSHQDITGKEDNSNKVTTTIGWGETLSDTKYPSEKLVKQELDRKCLAFQENVNSGNEFNVSLKIEDSAGVCILHNSGNTNTIGGVITSDEGDQINYNNSCDTTSFPANAIAVLIICGYNGSYYVTLLSVI